MSLFSNPCMCECEKQLIKNQMIVIIKRSSEQKGNQKNFTGSINKIEAIAMQPKSMQVRRQSLYKSNKLKEINNDIISLFLDAQHNFENLTTAVASPNISKKASHQFIYQKVGSIDKISTGCVEGLHKDHRILKQKIMNFPIQEQTQRKTMKKYANFVKQNTNNTKDMLLTTKRCKDKYNQLSSPPFQNKQELIKADKASKLNISLEKQQLNGIQNHKKFKRSDKKQNYSEFKIKIMVQEISLLKKQLKRLQDDESRLLIQKNLNQKFFEEDYAINSKKKQNLKKSCQQRYQQLNDLKKILKQCKNRII